MIEFWFEKFSNDTLAKQVERTQALAYNVRPYIYCNTITQELFGLGNKFNGCDVLIDDELDDCVCIIVSRRDKRGNIALPYVVGGVSDDVFDRLYFTLNDYKWIGYPDNIIRSERIDVIEKIFGIKLPNLDYGYYVCEELIRLDDKKCGTTSYPVEPISDFVSSNPVIWCKEDVSDEWSIIVPEQDDSGQFRRFCALDARANKLVDVKYMYKKEVKDWWFMSKSQVER